MVSRLLQARNNCIATHAGALGPVRASHLKVDSGAQDWAEFVGKVVDVIDKPGHIFTLLVGG